MALHASTISRSARGSQSAGSAPGSAREQRAADSDQQHVGQAAGQRPDSAATPCAIARRKSAAPGSRTSARTGRAVQRARPQRPMQQARPSHAGRMEAGNHRDHQPAIQQRAGDCRRPTARMRLLATEYPGSDGLQDRAQAANRLEAAPDQYIVAASRSSVPAVRPPKTSHGSSDAVRRKNRWPAEMAFMAGTVMGEGADWPYLTPDDWHWQGPIAQTEWGHSRRSAMHLQLDGTRSPACPAHARAEIGACPPAACDAGRGCRRRARWRATSACRATRCWPPTNNCARKASSTRASVRQFRRRAAEAPRPRTTRRRSSPPQTAYARRARELPRPRQAGRAATPRHLRYSFQYGLPLVNPALTTAWARELARAAAYTTPDYPATQGLPALREAICDYLARRRGVQATAGRRAGRRRHAAGGVAGRARPARRRRHVASSKNRSTSRCARCCRSTARAASGADG